ncbi:MAG: biotin--[acetyl-CoA-carboxylase] ligase [Thermoguttaceae bacterium]|nr:biotin--[acetyl-CoA-carboxylase] ligase [Thermoguttaceae bacterium]
MSSWNSLERPDCVTRVYHFSSIPSTNDWAHQYLTEHRLAADETILVVADRQTAGRGRGNHQWWSPDGLLAISLLMSWNQLGFSRETSPALSEHVARAVQKALVKQLDLTNGEKTSNLQADVIIKKPNDIYIYGKKIAGILIESPNIHDVIIGIGINVNNDISDAPVELRNLIISLKDITKCDTDVHQLAESLIHLIYSTQLD